MGSIANLCISDAELLIPPHIKIMSPVNATAKRKRVLVIRCSIALEGGSRFLADFHVTPPLGRSIVQKEAKCDQHLSNLPGPTRWRVLSARLMLYSVAKLQAHQILSHPESRSRDVVRGINTEPLLNCRYSLWEKSDIAKISLDSTNRKIEAMHKGLGRLLKKTQNDPVSECSDFV